jgi:16S rRNA (adenine(1408)-N(1))-methyltransferase
MLDLGTGDGAAVMRAARADPGLLAIGLDTDAAATREASRRAARAVRKGGLPNALFLAGSAAAAPEKASADVAAALEGRVHELRVTLPWGSLLRAVLEPRTGFGARAAGLLAPEGVLSLLLSSTQRDSAAGGVVLDGRVAAALAGAYEEAGLVPVECRPATRTDMERLGSSWARRLGIPERRAAWLILLRRGTEHARTIGRLGRRPTASAP